MPAPKQPSGRWVKFQKIDKPGDVTEAIYPFVFKKDYSEAFLITVGSLLLVLIPVLFSLQFNKQ